MLGITRTVNPDTSSAIYSIAGRPSPARLSSVLDSAIKDKVKGLTINFKCSQGVQFYLRHLATQVSGPIGHEFTDQKAKNWAIGGIVTLTTLASIVDPLDGDTVIMRASEAQELYSNIFESEFIGQLATAVDGICSILLLASAGIIAGSYYYDAKRFLSPHEPDGYNRATKELIETALTPQDNPGVEVIELTV
jgi:hypothetical protein